MKVAQQRDVWHRLRGREGFKLIEVKIEEREEGKKKKGREGREGYL
jgi:hypothetical protein